MSAEKVISVRKEGSLYKVYYRDSFIAAHVDGDADTLAAAVEAGIDFYIAKQKPLLDQLASKAQQLEAEMRRRGIR